MQENYRGCLSARNSTEPYMLYRKELQTPDEQRRYDQMNDIEYFQSMYPDKMKQVQKYVMNACDKLEYQNSPMYDEYPDSVMINQLCSGICSELVKDGIDKNWEVQIPEETDVEEVEIYEISRRRWGPPPGNRPPGPPPWGPPPGNRPPGPPPWGPPPGNRPPGPPPWGPPPGNRPPGPPPHPGNRPPSQNWMNDIVKVMLLNEIFQRRCRNGLCY